MTTKETAETHALILEIVSRFAIWPKALRLEVDEVEASDGPAYFVMQCHREDESVVIGIRGCHVDALALLVQEIGRACGRSFTFRALTPSGKVDQRYREPRDVVSYDAAPASDLLHRMLTSLDIGEFRVRYGPGDGWRQSLTYLFTIKFRDASDVVTMNLSRSIEGEGNQHRQPQTLIAAIGTLLRAIGKRDGVRFLVSVEHAHEHQDRQPTPAL